MIWKLNHNEFPYIKSNAKHLLHFGKKNWKIKLTVPIKHLVSAERIRKKSIALVKSIVNSKSKGEIIPKFLFIILLVLSLP